MWSVIGHERAVATLARSLAEDRLAHAYLFTGPAQIGKRTLARELAMALNCVGDAAPCGVCRPCRLIQAGKHPDVEELSLGGLCDQSDHDHRRDGSKDIKICQVRRMERVVSLRPFEGRSRVMIIDPANALNSFAADALLKTLEEPPPDVQIVLIAADVEILPETVVSRARRVALGPVAPAVIRQELIRRGVESERAELLARLSGGRIGWAFDHGSDAALLDERGERLDRIESLAHAGRAERMAFAAELAGHFTSARDDLFAYLDLWQSWWRDLLLVGEGCDHLVANSDRLATLRAIARAIPAAHAVQALRALRLCRTQLEDNANARLALEVFVLRLVGPVKREEVGPEWSAGLR